MLNLLIGSSHISLDMCWGVYEGVKVVGSLSQGVKVSGKVISLLNCVESCQKAIGSTSCVALGVLLECYDPAVEERNHVVPVKSFPTKVHPLVWPFLIDAEGDFVQVVHHVVQSHRSGVRDDFVGMSATALEDNCFVVEFLRHRVDQSNETSSILSF